MPAGEIYIIRRDWTGRRACRREYRLARTVNTLTAAPVAEEFSLTVGEFRKLKLYLKRRTSLLVHKNLTLYSDNCSDRIFAF